MTDKWNAHLLDTWNKSARATARLRVSEPSGGLSRRSVLAGMGALGGAALLSACSSSSSPSAASSTSSSAKPRRGGTLRLAATGNAVQYSNEQMAGQGPNHSWNGGEILVAHWALVFEHLAWRDTNGNIIPGIASEWSSNSSSTVWKIRIRDGVKFHDGSPLTAHDVGATLSYCLDEKNGAATFALLSTFMEPSGVSVIDKSTLQLTMSKPYALLEQSLSTYTSPFLVPAGAAGSSKAIGTGPFKQTSFSPGQSAVLSRNDDYWGGPPLLDAVELFLIVDPASRVSALQAGQIDALSQMDLTQVASLKKDPRFKILQHPGASSSAQSMRVDQAPFTDNNVRLAFKYMLDRKQLVDVALAGYGRVGNDIPNSFDRYAATTAQIPQRPYDPDMATSLLKKAGYSNNLAVTLNTTDADQGMLESSELMVQMAKQVGVTITLNQVPSANYFVTEWLTNTFGVDFFGARSLNDWISNSLYSASPQNTTHFNDPSFTALWEKAQGESNEQNRAEMFVELQKTLYDEGGLLMWGFIDNVDAYSSNLAGIEGGLYRDYNFYNFNKAYFSS
jgi:peptide/nickel transport system substrate-binding protein